MAIVLDGTTGITTPNVASDTSTLGPLTQALNLGSTGQIVFPATQNASANANTLDDYEEGTWTPTLAVNGFNNSRTFSSASGAYTKVGRLVTATCAIAMSGFCRPTSYVQVSGLPFSASPTFAGVFGAENAGTGIQGGSAMIYSGTSIFWYPSNGTTESVGWYCTVTYFAT